MCRSAPLPASWGPSGQRPQLSVPSSSPPGPVKEALPLPAPPASPPAFLACHLTTGNVPLHPPAPRPPPPCTAISRTKPGHLRGALSSLGSFPYTSLEPPCRLRPSPSLSLPAEDRRSLVGSPGCRLCGGVYWVVLWREGGKQREELAPAAHVLASASCTAGSGAETAPGLVLS